jgi:uncharacterized protein YjeT (DUF2065 family)
LAISEGQDGRKSQMKLAVLYVVVVGAVLFWWLRSVKPKRRI